MFPGDRDEVDVRRDVGWSFEGLAVVGAVGAGVGVGHRATADVKIVCPCRVARAVLQPHPPAAGVGGDGGGVETPAFDGHGVGAAATGVVGGERAEVAQVNVAREDRPLGAALGVDGKIPGLPAAVGAAQLADEAVAAWGFRLRGRIERGGGVELHVEIGLAAGDVDDLPPKAVDGRLSDEAEVVKAAEVIGGDGECFAAEFSAAGSHAISVSQPVWLPRVKFSARPPGWYTPMYQVPAVASAAVRTIVFGVPVVADLKCCVVVGGVSLRR